MRSYLILIFLFYVMPLSADSIAANSPMLEWSSRHADIMGTNIRIEGYENELVSKAACIDDVFSFMRRIDSLMSPYKASSDISKINDAKGLSIKVDPETHSVISHSLFYSNITDGVFDVTFASVGSQYDYKKKVRPSEKIIKKLLPRINFQSIELLDDYRIRIPIDTQLDLGGIAKGYAVDKSLAILKRCGFKSALVAAGGDMKMFGDINGQPMVVGIKNPRSRSEPLIRIPLNDIAVSTSGDYERFYFDGDERVHHIIDPETGRSSEKSQSVTILCEKSIDCDALSTSIFIMGPREGLALINRLGGYDAVIIDNEGKLHYSDGLLMGN